MTLAGSALAVESVSVERRGRRLLDDVSFSVRHQTVHALLGHNGAGKTTLLRAVAGLVPSTSGTIRVSGVPSVLFVGGRYPSDLTVAEIVRHRSLVLGGADPAAAISATGVDEFLGARGAALSTGMVQRLSLALALLAGAEVLVLDEPTSGLDPQGVERLRGIVLELRAAGCTVLVCSHDLAELELVCDDVTCLRQGRVTASGDVMSVASGLPRARQVVRTSDDRLAAAVLSHRGARAILTARGLSVDRDESLGAVLSLLAAHVDVIEVTVDRGLFARVYDRYAAEPAGHRARAPSRARARSRGRATRRW